MDFTSKSIKSSSSVTRANTTKKAARSGKASFKNTSHLSASSSSQETITLQPFAVTALDTALLDLSRNPTPSEKIAYGHELLNKLEHLKTNILSGSISHQDLLNLNDCIANKKLETDDPKLKTILKEIETRIAVELAKFGL